MVGMKISTATMENSMEVPQNTEHATTKWSNSLTTGCISKGNEILLSELPAHPSLLQHYFQKPGLGINPDAHWQMNGFLKMQCIYTVEYHSAIKMMKSHH